MDGSETDICFFVHRAPLEYQTTSSLPEDISSTTLDGTTVMMTWHGAFLPRMHQRGTNINADVAISVSVLVSVFSFINSPGKSERAC